MDPEREPVKQPPETIVCVECGGVARLNSYLPSDDSIEAGFPLAYVCSDCLQRHDLIWDEDDD